MKANTTQYLKPLRTTPLPPSQPLPAQERELSAPSLQGAPASKLFRTAETVSQGVEDPAELELWKKRYQSQLGVLTTPPRGEVAEKEKFAKAYLEQLVEQLAGDEIRAKGLDVRLELFSGSKPQATLDDSNQRELEWESEHPGQEWPVRTWLGVEPGNKPLYRMVVTEGMLETLQTREEVAFVLAGQLEKLFRHDQEDPQNEVALEAKGQLWTETREQQIANDSAAIARMCKAGINPQGSLKALDALYAKFGPQYSGSDQKVAVAAVAQVQEHEGVRISALQAQIELLRRKGEPATLKETELLPKEQFPQASGQYQSRLENFAAFQQGMDQLADQLSAPETPAWMFQGGPSPVALLKALRPTSQDYEDAMVGLIDHLQQSGKSPQQQVDGLLRTVLAFQGDFLSLSMSQDGLDKARAFLAGAEGWQPEPLLASLNRAEGGNLQRALTSQVLQNEAFQTLVAPLASKPGAVQSLMRSAAENYLHRPEDGAVDLQALPVFLQRNSLEPQSKWPLAGQLDAGALEVLKGQSPEELAAQSDDSGLPVGLVLCNELRRLEPASDDFALQLRSAMEPIQLASNARREDNALLRLRPPLQESQKLSAYLQELFASEAGQPFSGAFEEKLPALLTDVITSCNHQGELIYDTGRPRELESGLERRLCGMAQKGDGEALTFLGRHWAHELRLPTHSPRRAWTEGVARTLAAMPADKLWAAPEASPYGESLRKSLMGCFQLTDEALPDVSSASLSALNERREQGEFEPKADHFASPEEYQKARQAYQERCEAMKPLGRFMATAESRQTLSRLAILGHEPQVSLQVAAQLKPEGWVGLLEGAEEAVERSKLVRSVCNDRAVELVGSDAGSFLMDGFLAVEKQIPELDRFWDLAQRTVKLCPAAVESRKDTKSRFGQSLYERLQALETPQLKDWMGRDFVLDVLKPEQMATLLHKVLGAVTPSTPVAELAQTVAELNSTYQLQEKHPAAYGLIRDQVSEEANLQPGNLDQVFALDKDKDNPAALLGRMQGQIAGLSGLVAMTRKHSPADQLAAIEYLMGRSEEMPPFLDQAAESQSLGPVAEALRSARQELMEADPVARVMVANSFLAGPTGLMNTTEGKNTILNFVLVGVDPKFLKLARPMIQAVLFSQGDSESLAVAMVLASKPKAEGDKKLTEADILNKVFDSYGVPGVKMKQYLAFTSQFEHFRETFETAQDAANPLNYYETLRLVQDRFGSEWPSDLKIDRTLGSGSVNVAVRYFNEAKQKGEVVSLGREDIVEATRYDFARFNKFVDSLTSTEEGAANFGFVRGLIGIIQESVQLEFDKESAQRVQHQAFQTYQHKFADGWTVKSIDAFEVKHLGLFMEEAKGKTARKLHGTNPALYRKAMRHMAEAEFQLLKGQDATHNLRPRPNFANPDFHDGQVLIDEKEKTVTILDFGQAVPISNEEREGALDLLTVLGKLDGSKRALKRLNERFFPGAAEGLTREDLDKIWVGPNLQGKSFKAKKMDCFIRLLAAISQKGGKVPLSTVHWVLALNRQIVLGDKVGQGVKIQVGGMVANHKLGMPLTTYNLAHDTAVSTVRWVGGLAHGLVAWALPGMFDEEE